MGKKRVLSIMKGIILWVVVLMAPFSSGYIYAANDSENKAITVFKKAINKQERDIKEWLEKSTDISGAIDLINNSYVLPETLTFSFGGDDDPVYDPEDNTVYIPYFFVLDVEDYFKKANYNKNGVSIEQATLDSVLHTIFHELAHALIAMYDLPVLGREEDAADGLASVLLIENFNQGQNIVQSAADLFKLEGKDRGKIQIVDFRGVHSLDEQRYYTALCHIYGSDDKAYKHVKKEAGFSDERAEICVEDYDNLYYGWSTVLKPFRVKE